MGVFGAVVGRRGAVGFTLARISGCRGVIGFKVGTWLCPVREKVRPACSERSKIGVLWRVGRVISRKCRSRGCVGRILSRYRPDASHVGRTLSRRWRCWHAMRLYVGPARRAAHSQAEAGRALSRQTNRLPSHHAGAGGNTKNQAAISSAIAANDAKAANSASVARSLLLERHAVHVGFAQLEAGALVQAVRGLARGA